MQRLATTTYLYVIMSYKTDYHYLLGGVPTSITQIGFLHRE